MCGNESSVGSEAFLNPGLTTRHPWINELMTTAHEVDFTAVTNECTVDGVEVRDRRAFDEALIEAHG
jgi:hypothetical protein